MLQKNVRQTLRRLSQRRGFDVGVVGVDGGAVVADEFLNDGRTHASVFHQACGGVSQGVKGKLVHRSFDTATLPGSTMTTWERNPSGNQHIIELVGQCA